MKVLILEDDENRIKKFKEMLIGVDCFITKDPNEANKWLEEVEFDYIFLDHDLEDAHYLEDCTSNETTGLCTAEFLGNNGHLNQNAEIIVHSLNWSGRERMMQAMVGRKIRQIPFTNLVYQLSMN